MQNTSIEWTAITRADGTTAPGHTFNAWRGCTKVSPGCAHCYAEKQSKRNPKSLGVWGDEGSRVVAAEDYWRQPLAWDRWAKEAGERHRVFSLSMGDWLEDRAELIAPRTRLLNLIRNTPNLDWLLLSKRMENWEMAIGQSLIFSDDDGLADWLLNWSAGSAPANVWLGTSIENQEMADLRCPLLIKCPAVVRFLSVEPLLGPVDLTDAIRGWSIKDGHLHGYGVGSPESAIHWVIVGGESGPQARPMHPQWARTIRDQCEAAGVPFFFKQWGEWAPFATEARYAAGSLMPGNDEIVGGKCSNIGAYGDIREEKDGRLTALGSMFDANGVRRDQRLELIHKKDHLWGKNDLQTMDYLKLGKHAAGRLLDGREHSEFPKSSVEVKVTTYLTHQERQDEKD